MQSSSTSSTFGTRRPWAGSEAMDRTRRNHGLEHATVTLLSRHDPKLRLSGRSNAAGFYIYGPVQTELLRATVDEALRRLKGGEVELAIHPNCGTNLVTRGIMAGLTSYLGFLGANTTRSRLGRLPRVALLSGLAMALSQPVGTAVQKHITTSGEMGDLQVVDVQRKGRWGSVTHFVRTKG